jgi:hypothetical protein
MTQLVSESGGVSAAQSLMMVPWAMGGNIPITSAGFQLVVGLYMIEVAILLAMFVNKIQYGEDQIGTRMAIGKTLIFATLVYIIAWVMSYSMFGTSISSILMPV